MKKYLAAFGMLIVVALAATQAYAYVVGWLNQSFEVKEPITSKIVSSSKPENGTVYPGEVFTTEVSVTNVSAVTFGMAYDGWVGWNYKDVEGKAQTLRFTLSAQPTPAQKSKGIKLEKANVAPASSYYWGIVTLAIDPTGSGKNYQSYYPYERVNLNGNGTHLLRAGVRASAEIPPGYWEVHFSIDRGEPTVSSTESQPPATPAAKNP